MACHVAEPAVSWQYVQRPTVQALDWSRYSKSNLGANQKQTVVCMNVDCDVGLCHGDREITTNPTDVSTHPTSLAGVLNMTKTETLSTINTNVTTSNIFNKKTQHVYIDDQRSLGREKYYDPDLFTRPLTSRGVSTITWSVISLVFEELFCRQLLRCPDSASEGNMPKQIHGRVYLL